MMSASNWILSLTLAAALLAFALPILLATHLAKKEGLASEKLFVRAWLGGAASSDSTPSATLPSGRRRLRSG